MPRKLSKYETKVWKNIKNLSSADSFEDALKDWICIDTAYDNIGKIGECIFCGKKNIRYTFSIRIYTSGKWNTGGDADSYCMERLGIKILDENKNEVPKKEVRKYLAQSKRDARINSFSDTLRHLSEWDGLESEGLFEEALEKAWEVYDKQKMLSPKHLSLVIWRAEALEVLLPSPYLIDSESDSGKKQILNMHKWKLRKLIPYIPRKQRKILSLLLR